MRHLLLSAGVVLVWAMAGCEGDTFQGPEDGDERAGSGGNAGSGGDSGGTDGSAGEAIGGAAAADGEGGSAGDVSGGGGTSGAVGASGGSSGTTGGAHTSGGNAGATGGTDMPGGRGGAGASGGSSGGGAGSAGTGNALYHEDFEDGVADGWLQTNAGTATWSVVTDTDGNHVYRQLTTSSTEAWVVHASPTWLDARVEVRVRFVSEDQTGAAFHLGVRYSSLDDYLRAELRVAGEPVVERYVNGDSNPVLVGASEVAAPLGTWHRLALVVQGSMAALEYDGVLVGSGTDSLSLTQGGIALGVSRGVVDVDDVTVTAP